MPLEVLGAKVSEEGAATGVKEVVKVVKVIKVVEVVSS